MRDQKNSGEKRRDRFDFVQKPIVLQRRQLVRHASIISINDYSTIQKSLIAKAMTNASILTLLLLRVLKCPIYNHQTKSAYTYTCIKNYDCAVNIPFRSVTAAES